MGPAFLSGVTPTLFWGGSACSSSFQHKAKQHVHAD
jgi:hypothetical protein